MKMTIRTHQGGWAVFAQWLGKERPVFGGKGTSVHACIDWKEKQR